MFTCYVGFVGAGKTYSMMKVAKKAFEEGQTIFTNIEINSDYWDNSKGGKIRLWKEPTDLLARDVHCGLVVFDELGAFVNSRKFEEWPIELTIKLIEHRKDHLDIVATVQDDELADKNVRRFYNQVYKVREYRLPLLGWLFPKSSRDDLPCPFENCNKGDHNLTRGDKHRFGGWGTVYKQHHMDPRYTQNKEKHNSKGNKWALFDKQVAMSYASASKVSQNALDYNARMQNTAVRRRPHTKVAQKP